MNSGYGRPLNPISTASHPSFPNFTYLYPRDSSVKIGTIFRHDDFRPWTGRQKRTFPLPGAPFRKFNFIVVRIVIGVFVTVEIFVSVVVSIVTMQGVLWFLSKWNYGSMITVYKFLLGFASPCRSIGQTSSWRGCPGSRYHPGSPRLTGVDPLPLLLGAWAPPGESSSSSVCHPYWWTWSLTGVAEL